MHIYAFFFKGPCDIEAVFLNYFKECHKKMCFADATTEFVRNVNSPINSEDLCDLIRLKIRGSTAVTPSFFELYIFQNESNSDYGLEIKELKRTSQHGQEVVKTSNVCRAVEADRALEDFRTFFHINFSRTMCRRKHGNRELGYPASDEEAAAAHFEGIKSIVDCVSDVIEEHKKRFVIMQHTIDAMSAEIAHLKAAREETCKRSHEEDEVRKRQRVSE